MSGTNEKRRALEMSDRVRKRGYAHEGTVCAVTELGVRVTWDAGRLAKERPLYCHPGELERVVPQPSSTAAD